LLNIQSNIFISLTIIGLCLQCTESPRVIETQNNNLPVPVNLNHALSITKSIKYNDQNLSYISIYADAPEYTPVVATGEGIACVDDVGRFLEVLAVEFKSKPELLETIRGLTKFLLVFKNNDGTWHNFLKSDGSINRDHKNSKAEFGWWAIRGLRGLNAAWEVFSSLPNEQAITYEISQALLRSITHIEKITAKYPVMIPGPGGSRSGWLLDNAPDKTSELLLVLVRMHKNGLYDFSRHISILSEGLIGWQFVNSKHDLNGMYFCWNNIWHNWGNNQAFALMQAYTVTGETRVLESVKVWADNFVPYLINNKFPRKITIDESGKYEVEKFPQIAYGINSIYQGMKSLAEITGDERYNQYSEQIFGWYTGSNSAGVAMYDPASGRCNDGINSFDDVNYNSGAESTVECLQSIQRRGIFN